MGKEQRLSRRELNTQFADWSTNSEGTDDLPKHLQQAINETAVPRRRLLKGTLIGGAAIFADKYTTAWWETVTPDHAEIGWMPGQEERLRNKETDSMLLVFGGASVRESGTFIRPIVTDLEPFGAVGHVDYANDGFDIKGTADRIEDEQGKYPQVKKVAVYGQSLGTLVAARVMHELKRRGSDLQLESLIMDCTPPDISYVDNAATYDRVATINDWYDGSALFPMLGNMILYGNPFQPGTAPTHLLQEDGVILQKGLTSMLMLAEIVKQDQTKVGFLTPKDRYRDNGTDAARSEQSLQIFFPNMDTFEIEHHEGEDENMHASPDRHTKGYQSALAEMGKRWNVVPKAG